MGETTCEPLSRWAMSTYMCSIDRVCHCEYYDLVSCGKLLQIRQTTMGGDLCDLYTVLMKNLHDIFMGHLRAAAGWQTKSINERRWGRLCVCVCAVRLPTNCQAANRQFFFINIFVAFLLSDLGLCRTRATWNLLLAALTLPDLTAVHLVHGSEHKWRRRRSREKRRATSNLSKNIKQKPKEIFFLLLFL